MTDYWSNFCFRQGEGWPVSNALIGNKSQNLHLQNGTEGIFRYLEPYGVTHECDERTDRQTRS